MNAEIENVPFQKLDFVETSILDTFYNADLVIVDMSVMTQQSSLFYHIGVRESMGMKYNMVLVHDVDPEVTVSLGVNIVETLAPIEIDICHRIFTNESIKKNGKVPP